MLKDTHLDAYGSITKAVGVLRSKLGHTVKIEVEVGSLEELKEVEGIGEKHAKTIYSHFHEKGEKDGR